VIVWVRPFGEADLVACLAITNAVDPARSITLAEAQRNDDTWNVGRYHRSRYVAEEAGGRIVGWGELVHTPWQFHPDKYGLRLEVDPTYRRRGAGGLLLERLLDELRARAALLVRAGVTESDVNSIRFLNRHGFREVWRNLESRLELAALDPLPFAGAAERVESQGVTVTTLAAEITRDPGVLRKVYELYASCNRDQEELDPLTPRPFEEWVANEVEGPRAIPEAWFLARDGQRFIGLSTLERLIGSGEVLEAGYTAVHPAYRGRGIALALKLRTISYARDHGYHYIKTDSSAVNERMLSINAALGFRPQPARITFELRLA
jgi:GNAT superfamily N-acetyltransferase